MKQSLLASLTLAAIATSSLTVLAQTSSQTTIIEERTQTTTVKYRNSITILNRAKNYARQAAEERNGGLQRYHAEALMHGPVERTRFVENADGTVTFTFLGGPPGFRTPTIESVVLVAVNGWTTRVLYNGAIRSASTSQTMTTTTTTTVSTPAPTTTVAYRNSISILNRAKNYARQAAEERNGGLQRYQAEALMHGPVERTRLIENNDGTVTFTFLGGSPGFRTATIESVVTVTINGWRTRVDYNGPIRRR